MRLALLLLLASALAVVALMRASASEADCERRGGFLLEGRCLDRKILIERNGE